MDDRGVEARGPTVEGQDRARDYNGARTITFRIAHEEGTDTVKYEAPEYDWRCCERGPSTFCLPPSAFCLLLTPPCLNLPSSTCRVTTISWAKPCVRPCARMKRRKCRSAQ